MRGRDGACCVCLAGGTGAAMLRDEHLASGAGLLQLLLKTVEGVAQSLSFGGLIFQLLGEGRHELLLAQAALQCGAGKVILLFLDGKFGFTIPLVHGVLMLLELFLEEVLVSDGDGHLGLDLEELVLHVKNELFAKLLGVFSSLNEIVDVGS